jgi:ABC-2 type transport system ATP-binding protein
MSRLTLQGEKTERHSLLGGSTKSALARDASGTLPSYGASMDATIEMHGLTKRFGDTVAIDDLSVTVRPGRVTGFVGPNGAGKTTTMHLILGLSAADAGAALVAGRPYRDLPRPLTVVGALLDAAATHPGRSARDHLLWLAQSNRIGVGRIDEVLQLVGLSSVAGRRTGGFSLGMRQRLGLAAALLGDPPVLILDEPTNGLDPEGIQWLRALLRSLADQGRTVFVSSHLMSELEGTADHVIAIGHGRLLADASVDDLIASTSDSRVELSTPETTRIMALLAAEGATVTSTSRGALSVEGLPAERIVDLVSAAGLALEALTPHRPTLEDAYFRLTRGAVEHSGSALADLGTRS